MHKTFAPAVLLMILLSRSLAQQATTPQPVTAPNATVGATERTCKAVSTPRCSTAPKAIKSPDPKYPRQGLSKRTEGTVVLWLIVGADGLPRDIKVVRSLGDAFDESAVKAVEKWKFKPATLDGQPAATQINIQVQFRCPYPW